jgi:TetR/AcrR family transcriptional regulator, transcriptional repressor for nem operon
MTKPNTREQIVKAGLQCLLERGYNGVAVQDITSAAGVPKGSFYNHFDSKEALGAEIVERYGAGSTRREILADTAIAPLDRLRRHFERLNAIFTDAKFQRGCILGNFSAELSGQSDLIRASLGDLYGRWTTDLESAIGDAQQRGDVANKIPAADIAAFLLDAYEGALLRARVERTSRPFERFMQLAFGQILT